MVKQVINWIQKWQPGCWCFDRRPIYSDQRPHGSLTQSLSQYDFTHAWVWFLWAPRDEALPHVMPHAWGFANGDDWSLVDELTGRAQVLQLAPGQSDWVYLCDTLIACDDMITRIASEIALLKDEERHRNLNRIAEAFGAPDSEDFQMFLEATLKNDTPPEAIDQYAYFFHGYDLLRQGPTGRVERFDQLSRIFCAWEGDLSGPGISKIRHTDAIGYIRGTAYNKKES